MPALFPVVSLEGTRGSLDDACDHLLRSLAPRREDDTTVVLARIPPGGPPALPPVHL